MKINKSYILAFLSIPFLSIASDSTDSTIFSAEIYNISVNNNNGKVILDNPLVRSDVSPWTNWTLINEPINRDPWTPKPSTVNMNQSFLQTSECDDNEIRTQTTTNHYADGQVIEIVDSEYNEVLVNISQSAVGTKNYVVTTEIKYGNWIDVGKHYSCSTWTPSASTINSGVKLTKKRSCKQNQSQNVKTYNVWSNGTKTLASERNNTKTISESESQKSTGTKVTAPAGYWKGHWASVRHTSVSICRDKATYPTPDPSGGCSTLGAIKHSCTKKRIYSGMGHQDYYYVRKFVCEKR